MLCSAKTLSAVIGWLKFLAAAAHDTGRSEAGTENRGPLCRPESRIAVVAHAGIIRHTLSAFAKGLPRAAASDLTQEFNNCEMRSIVLSDATVAPPSDKTRFPGGHQWETAHL